MNTNSKHMLSKLASFLKRFHLKVSCVKNDIKVHSPTKKKDHDWCCHSLTECSIGVRVSRIGRAQHGDTQLRVWHSARAMLWLTVYVSEGRRAGQSTRTEWSWNLRANWSVNLTQTLRHLSWCMLLLLPTRPRLHVAICNPYEFSSLSERSFEMRP